MTEEEGTAYIPAPRRDATSGPATIVFIAPPGPMLGKRFELKSGEAIIGRAEGLAITCSVEGVSRRHARLAQQSDGSWLIEDLGSTNGTWVNEERVASRVLQDGDQLGVGHALAKFFLGDNAEAAYHEEIYRMTVMDALTGVHNKRYFLEFLTREIASARRHRQPLSLVMFDVDHFKKVNDVHGHLAGDAVLREIGRRLRPRIRTDDLLARYGGEEFGVVLKTGLEGAALFAEQLRALIADEPFVCSETLSLPVTISLGAAEVTDASPVEPEDLIRRADENLYAAKHGGRNRVVAG
jgi:diguanylate cyclase (GGDEF)-like protein